MEQLGSKAEQPANDEVNTAVQESAGSDTKLGQVSTALVEVEDPPIPYESFPRSQNIYLSQMGFAVILDKIQRTKPVAGKVPPTYRDFLKDLEAKGDPEALLDTRSKYAEHLKEFYERAEVLKDVMPTFVNEVLKAGSGRRERAEELVGQLDAQVDRRLEHPTSLICIPLAIHDENPDNIRNTLAELSKQTDAGNNEVIIYANNPDDDDSKRKATDGLLALKPILDLYPNLRVRVIHRSYTSEELQDSMMRIRPDYMDAVVLEAHKRGLDPETPVIWLDADITKMGKDATSNLARDVKSCKTPFVKPNLNFTVEMEKLTTDLDPTNVDHLTAIDEILRRKSNRESVPDDTDAYVEECGLAFSLNTYCLSGGVTIETLGTAEQQGGFGESAMMMWNLSTMLWSAPHLTKVLYPELSGYSKMAKKASDSRIYTSSRRIKKSIGDFHRSSRVGNPRDEYNMQQFFSEDYRGSEPSLGATISPEFAENMLEQSLNQNNPHGLSRREQAEEYRKMAEKKVQRLTRGRYKPRAS